MKTDQKYTVEKIMLTLSQSIGTYEYRLLNKYGLCVATICCEDLALWIRDLLNGDVERHDSDVRLSELLEANLQLQERVKELEKGIAE